MKVLTIVMALVMAPTLSFEVMAERNDEPAAKSGKHGGGQKLPPLEERKKIKKQPWEKGMRQDSSRPSSYAPSGGNSGTSDR